MHYGAPLLWCRWTARLELEYLGATRDGWVRVGNNDIDWCPRHEGTLRSDIRNVAGVIMTLTTIRRERKPPLCSVRNSPALRSVRERNRIRRQGTNVNVLTLHGSWGKQTLEESSTFFSSMSTNIERTDSTRRTRRRAKS